MFVCLFGCSKTRKTVIGDIEFESSHVGKGVADCFNEFA